MNTNDAWSDAQRAGEPSPIERIAASILDQILSKSNVQMVFGEPVQHGDYTVIPVARVRSRFGFGAGGGGSNTEDGRESGSGGGGGGAIEAKPIGYIEITPQGAEFHEISDETQIALAAIRVGTIIAVAIAIRILLGRRRSPKHSAASLEVRANRGRRFGLGRKQTLVEIVPDVTPADRPTRRWRRKAA